MPLEKEVNTADPHSPPVPDGPIPPSPPAYNFWIIPIPKCARWNVDRPHKFNPLLKSVFFVAAVFSNANPSYYTSIQVYAADYFDVSEYDVTVFAIAGQVGFALGVAFLGPLGDLLRRRQLVLTLVLVNCLFSMILALVRNWAAFSTFNFLLGFTSVIHQILLAFVGDICEPDRRAAQMSFVLSGMVLGPVFARVVGGLICKFASVSVLFWVVCGAQLVVFFILWATLPDYPAKNPELHYFKLMWTTLKYLVTEPVLAQCCLVMFFFKLIQGGFWGSLAFILAGLYGYNPLQIGLASLITVIGVFTAPFVGKLIDRLVPWAGVLIGFIILSVSQTIYISAAGASVGAVITVNYLNDLANQVVMLTMMPQIIALGSSTSSRMMAGLVFTDIVAYMFGLVIFPRVYLSYGYHWAGATGLLVIALGLVSLFLRGPHCGRYDWIGWAGGWALRKTREERIEGPVVGSAGEDLEKRVDGMESK